jgi:hypothetical protein
LNCFGDLLFLKKFEFLTLRRYNNSSYGSCKVGSIYIPPAEEVVNESHGRHIVSDGQEKIEIVPRVVEWNGEDREKDR